MGILGKLLGTARCSYGCGAERGFCRCGRTDRGSTADKQAVKLGQLRNGKAVAGKLANKPPPRRRSS